MLSCSVNDNDNPPAIYRGVIPRLKNTQVYFIMSQPAAPPPSPTDTVAHCPTCRQPELIGELAELTAAVAALVALHATLEGRLVELQDSVDDALDVLCPPVES